MIKLLIRSSIDKPTPQQAGALDTEDLPQSGSNRDEETKGGGPDPAWLVAHQLSSRKSNA